MGNRGSKCSDILLYALEDLSHADFKRFKDKLSDIDFKGRKNIARGKLEKADQIDTKNLLVKFYGMDSAIDVTIEVFTKVSLMEPAARLREERQRVLDPRISQAVPGATSDYRRIYMKHIAERYRMIKDRNARVGETVPLEKRYTKLLIVQKYRYEEERQHEIMSYGKKHTDILDSLALSTHYTDLDALFASAEDGRRPRTIVLQGPAGIGKTMTAQKIMLDWALGELYQELFDYVFYLSCREINRVKSHKSAVDVIAASFPDRTLPMSALLVDPNKILFIIDGFDELKFSLDLKEDQHCSDPFQKNPVEVTLSNLLRRNILSGCSMIITTRPTAVAWLMQCIKAHLCAEIIGFTEEDRKSYFKGFFDNDENASRALAVVKDNDILYTMCFLPIVCWIVCTVMKQQMERGQDIKNSSKTTTSVYLFFLSTLLRDHCGSSVQTMQRCLKKLCSLALSGIFKQRILFDEEDLKQYGLEVSDIQSLFLNQTIFQQDIDVYTAYSFIHLSFQEFFAAMFYILDVDVGTASCPLNPQTDVNHLLRVYSQYTNGHFMLTVRFLFGLMSRNQTRHVEKDLGCKISQSVKADLMAWLQKLKGDSLVLDLFHCLHEVQDEDIVSNTMNNIQNITVANFYPRGVHYMDYKVVSFCLSCSQGDKTLNVSNVHFGPEIQEIMKPGVMKCSTFSLCWCVTTDKVDLLDSPSSEYGIGHSRPSFADYFSAGESNLSLLCEALRDRRCHLKKLRIKNCRLSDLCCQDLALVLAAQTSLKELDLSQNSLQVRRLAWLVEGLARPTQELQKLTLEGCSLCPDCCKELSVLLAHPSLRELNICENPMGDSGIGWICTTLKHPNCKLQTLLLKNCQLTSDACSSLSSVLPLMWTLTELDLSCNTLGDSGMSRLCPYLMHPKCKLQTLRVQTCDLTVACCKDLASVISSSCYLQTLDLIHNSLQDRGIILLCDGLKSPTSKLNKLNIRCCEITGACCEDLAAFLHVNRSLLDLNLDSNELDDAGVYKLCDILKQPDNQVQKIEFEMLSFSSSVLDELKRARPELEIVEHYP
ncbi:NACHT, LRR and PYD domains-containing protein 12-like isoform X2 [Pleurodeles waltl]|uniref:NACHT, LRR and PYD domains-containing protein 12-like isoform X2 n=1 Tax=Pleurodeles waltl TaxID=8319 RepID=UPI003709BF6C